MTPSFRAPCRNPAASRAPLRWQVIADRAGARCVRPPAARRSRRRRLARLAAPPTRPTPVARCPERRPDSGAAIATRPTAEPTVRRRDRAGETPSCVSRSTRRPPLNQPKKSPGWRLPEQVPLTLPLDSGDTLRPSAAMKEAERVRTLQQPAHGVGGSLNPRRWGPGQGRLCEYGRDPGLLYDRESLQDLSRPRRTRVAPRRAPTPICPRRVPGRCPSQRCTRQ